MRLLLFLSIRNFSFAAAGYRVAVNKDLWDWWFYLAVCLAIIFDILVVEEIRKKDKIKITNHE
jgi:hypothetical protein